MTGFLAILKLPDFVQDQLASDSGSIEWIVANPNDWSQMLAEDEIDVIAAFPPMNQNLRAQKLGHVILNTMTDKPWRYYFCCMLATHNEFAQSYPIATRRALRAILKASQLCKTEPELTARWLVNKGFSTNYDYTLQSLQEISYKSWRDYDPEDTLCFYSVRLYEMGLIKLTPQDIISQGTDWRFLNELKKELKV